MTLPASGPISLWGMASEFGLAQTAVFPTAYYGKGGAPGSGALSFSNFYGRSGVAVTPHGGGFSKSAGPGGTATVSYALATDGTERNETNTNIGTWINDASQRGNYWARATLTIGSSGDFTGSGFGTWINLASAVAWGMSQVGNGSKSGSFTLEISSNSSGTAIVATTGVNFQCDVGFL